MPKATAVLFGIEDEFDVVSVDRLEPGQVRIIIESVSREGPCPVCGVISGRVKDRAVSEITREYGVSWPTGHRALVAAAARWLPEPTPTSGSSEFSVGDCGLVVSLRVR